MFKLNFILLLAALTFIFFDECNSATPVILPPPQTYQENKWKEFRDAVTQAVKGAIEKLIKDQGKEQIRQAVEQAVQDPQKKKAVNDTVEGILQPLRDQLKKEFEENKMATKNSVIFKRYGQGIAKAVEEALDRILEPIRDKFKENEMAAYIQEIPKEFRKKILNDVRDFINQDINYWLPEDRVKGPETVAPTEETSGTKIEEQPETPPQQPIQIAPPPQEPIQEQSETPPQQQPNQIALPEEQPIQEQSETPPQQQPNQIALPEEQPIQEQSETAPPPQQPIQAPCYWLFCWYLPITACTMQGCCFPSCY